MPTPMATMLIGLAGERVSNHEHREILSLTEATTVTGGRPLKINVFQPWTHANVVDLVKWHPLAVSTKLVVKVVVGQGAFGRAITLHSAWGNQSEQAPTSLAEMSRMYGYSLHTYGGAADPGEGDRTFTAEFNPARSDVLKARHYMLGGQTVLYYFFTENKFGSTQVDAERFYFHVIHDFELYGRN